MRQNGLPMDEGSEHSWITSGTGNPADATALITRASRSIACADDTTVAGGLRRRTNLLPAPWMRYVGLDCPPVNLDTSTRLSSSGIAAERWRRSDSASIFSRAGTSRVDAWRVTRRFLARPVRTSR